MAVNDLMMRIQLLVDSGKSSAELNRVQSSLNALTKDLNRLSQIKLNLKDQLSGLAELGSKLKQVNLGNFATSITELEKAFGKLNLPTTQLTKLRDAFQNIEVAKAAQATSSYAKDLAKVNQQLKDAKNYTLTNDRQVFNSSLSLQNQLLIANASKVKDVNDYIVTQRKEIVKLNEHLKNSATLYADQRKSQGQLSLFSLNRGLGLDTANAKLWAEELNKAKSNLVAAKDNLKAIKQEASQLTKQKILDFGIADSDKNAGAIRSTIAEMNRLTAAIDTQKLRLDAFKSFKPIKTILLEDGLTKNAESLRATNKLIDEQKIKTAQLTTSKLLAAQATEKELRAIESLNSRNLLPTTAVNDSKKLISTLKSEFVDLNKQVTTLKATDLTSFAQPILDATSKVNAAKEAYQQLKVETLRAAAAVKTASVVDPTAYKAAIDSLKTYREDVVQSAKVLDDNKAKLSNVRDELKLVNQEYRDFAAKLREAKQLAKSFQLPSQQTQLAEYTRLNQELDNLRNKRSLFKTSDIDPAIDKVRALRNQIKAVGTDDASVSLFKNANQQILTIKEQLNNLKFGGVKGTLDLGSLITQFGQLQSGGRSLESISQRMLELRTQVKATKPDVEALKQTLISDKEKILIGKESIANAQKSLSDLKIAAKAARDGVLTELAPIAIQLKNLGETRISKANLTEGLLNEVSRLKKALNDIQPQGMESIRKATDGLNTSLTALRFGNEKGIIPVGQVDEGKKSIAALKQEIESLKVSARTIKFDNKFFTDAKAPNLSSLIDKAGLSDLLSQNEKMNASLQIGIKSWDGYNNRLQSWTSLLRKGQSDVLNLKKSLLDSSNAFKFGDGVGSLKTLTTQLSEAKQKAEEFNKTNLSIKSDELKQAQSALRNMKLVLPQITGLDFYQQQLNALNGPLAAAQSKMRDLRLEMQRANQVKFDGKFFVADSLGKLEVPINSIKSYINETAKFRTRINDAKDSVSALKNELRNSNIQFKIGDGENSLKTMNAELSRLKQLVLDQKNNEILPKQKNLRDAQAELRDLGLIAKSSLLDISSNILDSDNKIRGFASRIRDVRAEMQRVGTVNFNQAFRDEGVVNLLDKMNQVKKSVVDIQKVSAGQQQPIVGEAETKTLALLKERKDAVNLLKVAYEGLNGTYKKDTESAKAYKSAIDALKSLSPELGKTFTVNLNEASFKQRFNAALASLENQANTITVPIQLKGLTEIQNQIRTLAAEKGLEKALNVDTVSASAKAIKAEIDVLKELKKTYSELANPKVQGDERKAHEARRKFLNDELIARKTITAEFKDGMSIETRIIELEGKNVSLKLQSADAAKKIADNQTVAIAKLREQEATGKNNLNNLSQEAKEINQIIAAERNRAKLAKETQQANLLGLTLGLNAEKDTKSGLQGLLASAKQQYAELTVKANEFLNSQRKALNLARDQQATNQADVANQSKKIQDARELNRISNEIGQQKIGDSLFNLAGIQNGLRSLKEYFNTLKDASKIKVSGIRDDIFNLQGGINNTRSLADNLNVLIKGSKQLGQEFLRGQAIVVNGIKNQFDASRVEYNKLVQLYKDKKIEIGTAKLGQSATEGDIKKQISNQALLNQSMRLGITILNDFGKVAKSNANEAYVGIQKQVGGLLEQLGLLKRTESSYLKQLADQRDLEKAAKSAALTAKDSARLSYNAAQLESETNQNALRGSRERASALRDISSAIRANATVAGLANANEIRSGESLITQLRRQYQQYQANEAATRNSIAAKKTASDASLSGLYEELAGLQRQRVALLDVQGILRRRGADQGLILKTESARQAGLREELKIQKQLAEITASDKKSVLGGLGDQIKSAVSSITALKNAAKGIATGLTIGDVGGNAVLQERVGLTQKLRDLTKATLGFAMQLNQDRSTRDTQGSVVKDLEAQAKATKAIAVANLEAKKNQELNGQSSLVTAKQVLATAQLEEKAAKSRNEIALAGLNTKIAENTVAIATAKQNVSVLESEIAKRNEKIAAIREEQALRVAAVAKEIESLNIAKSLTNEENARITARKNDLTSALDKENASRKQAIELLKQQIEVTNTQRTAAVKGLDDLIAASRKSNLESQRAVQADIVGRENSIKLTQQAVESVNKKILADKEAIKQYQTGLKEYEKGIRASIVDANQRIASGQLSKTQLAEERQGIKELVKEQQNLSKAYIGRLTEQANNLQSSLKGERERIKLLEQQANAETDAIQKQVLMNAALRAKNELTKIGGQEQSLTRQIQETGDLAKVEMQRLAILERLATAGQKQNFNAAIQETQRLAQETTKRLGELAAQSEIAKTKLSDIGGKNDLPKVKEQIKDIQGYLNELRKPGNFNALEFEGGRETLRNLREQQKLLTQIAQIDTKTASGKVELGDLTKQINQLREAQREMSKLNRFAQGFKQGFTFALQPDQLGMAAFNTIQQALSELGRKFIEVNAQSETLIRGLSAVFGAGQGEVQFEKLTGLANTYGLSLHDLSRNYLSLNASSKGTILEGQESEKIFKSLSAAMAVLGADTITSQRAFRAVSQMISKGQVYAEELKGQLAEALPGAIQIFARSMGKTTSEFLAMVKAGQVGLNELIPFFAQIQQEYGAAATASTTYEQATNRLSNQFLLLLKNIGDSGVWKVLVGLIDLSASSMGSLADSAKQSANDIRSLSRDISLINGLRAINLKADGDRDLIDDFMNYIKTKYNETRVYVEANKLPVYNPLNPLGFLVQPVTIGIDSIKNSLSKPIEQMSLLKKLTQEEYDALNKIGVESRDFVLAPSLAEENAQRDKINKAISAENEVRKKANAEKRLATALALAESSEMDQVHQRELSRISSVQVGNAKLNAITKQQVREEQNALNIRQQSYQTLSFIQQNLLQRSLKATGVSDTVSTEVQSVAKLTEVYKQLAIAKDIEARIISNPANPRNDTSEQDAEAIRKLTIDQLKHTQTVARGANNLAVQLRIMMEIERLQRIITEKTTANTTATNANGVASQSVLEKTKALSISLSNATTKGYEFARAIADGLSYTEQMNALLSQQKVLIAQSNNEKLKSKITNKEEIKQAEDTAKAIKKSQEDSGQYFTDDKKAADLAYMSKREYFANAEESWAAARKSTNALEKTQLMEIVKENLDLAKAKAIASGDAYGVKQIQSAIEELRLYKEGVNSAAIAAQQAELGKKLNFDENNKFDLAKSLGDFRTAFNEQLKIRQDAIKAINEGGKNLSESDKAAYQKVIDDANAKINALNAIYPKLEEAAKNAGQTIPVDIKATIPQEVLDAERIKLETITKDIPANVNLTYNNILETLPDISQRVNLVYSGSGGSSSSATTPSSPDAKVRWGGHIPGWGGGDRVRALLEPGEFVLRKEAVRALGLDQVNKWNRMGGNLRMPRSVDSISIPHFASGGLVGGSPITINVPGSKPIQVTGSRDSAMALANLLTRTGRAL